jgi:soluble P-type ATPase
MRLTFVGLLARIMLQQIASDLVKVRLCALPSVHKAKESERLTSMLILDIPGRERIELEHLVCDFNGTLAEDGYLWEGVAWRVTKIGAILQMHLLTADTFGTSQRAAEALQEACAASRVTSPHWERVATGQEKEHYVQSLGAHRVVAVGNGANDAAMLRAAALSICVVGSEGACTQAVLAAQVVVTNPIDALDAILRPARLTATLRQ